MKLEHGWDKGDAWKVAQSGLAECPSNFVQELEMPCPPPAINFFEDKENTKQIGRLWMDETGFHFEGDADASAQKLFNFLKGILDNYLEQRRWHG